MKPTTEVILCTYNGAAFVIEQLESILGQTTRVDRISIFDDRSTDDTIPKIREFLRRVVTNGRPALNLRVNPTTLGYRQNFCAALAEAREDVLFLCDQDDIWETHKVESLLGLFARHGADMVFSDGSIVDASGRCAVHGSVLESYGLTARSIAHFGDSAFDRLLKRNYVNGAASAIRRAAAQAALPLPVDMPHDYWMAIWCALHNGIAATPQRLYRYRQHPHNVIGIGSSYLPHVLLGIWRHAHAPRRIELARWQAVAERIADLHASKECAAARRKVEWLSRVVAGDERTARRGYEILKSAFNGSYRDYSTSDAFLRDIASLIKS